MEGRISLKTTALLALAAAVLTFTAAGQDTPGEIAASLAIKITSPIEIDGGLSEPAWDQAPEAAAYLVNPVDRENPSQIRTSIRILFDQSTLYLGFLCTDEEKEDIFAELTDRDADLRDDDSVYILMESKNEPDGYAIFMTNPRGARTDGLVSRDGQLADPTWDTSWQAAGRHTDFGWSAEVAIDLTELGFAAGENLQINLKLARIVPRLDSLFRSGPLDPAFSPQDFMQLTPLELLRSWKSLSGTAHLTGWKETGGDTQPGGGLDLNYAISPGNSAAVTLNPDFTDVEPDEERINLSVFELDLPEKRLFFQNGPDASESRLRLFHSKRLGDIRGGARIEGRTGSLEYSALSAFSEADEAAAPEQGNTTTVRVKGDLFKGFTLAMTAVNRRMGGGNQGAAALDAHIPLMHGFSLNGRFATSYGEFSEGNNAFYLGPQLDNVNTHAHLFYTHIGDRFGDNVNPFGYIPDDNRREIDAGLSHTFVLNRGQLDRIRYESGYDVYWGMDDTLRRWQVDQGVQLSLKNKWMFTIRHTEEYILNEGWREAILIPGSSPDPLEYVQPVWFTHEDFRNNRTSVSSGMNKGEGNRFVLEFTLGKNFGSDFQMMRMSKDFRASNSIFGEFTFYNVHYSLESLRFYSTSIIVLKSTIAATDSLNLRFMLQHNKAISKTSFQVFALVRIWPHHGSVQAGYQIGTAPFGQKGDQDHTVLLKLLYMF